MIRNFVFAIFCFLILVVTLALTYYITFYDETKHIKAKNEDNGDEDVSCSSIQHNFFIGTFFFKIISAFFAGGMLSDRLFIKLGVI